jgi:succinyldiaminopimelate transaminase
VTGFQPPVYPYDRLIPLRDKAAALPGGAVDLSIGTPGDPPSPAVLAALASTEADATAAARGYPPSAGTAPARRAAASWMERRFGLAVDPSALALCIGTKEFVGTLPQWLRLRHPERDTVLYPALSYPTYEMGAILAGLRAVPVAVDEQFRLDLASIGDDDARRALVLWVNSPGNPAGQLDDLDAAAAWGAEHRVLVASDECYAELTWKGAAQTILGRGSGPDGMGGVLAVHSLSKRSNLAGLRFGWYAGDPGVVAYLRDVRQHAGFMVPGPAQRAGIVALEDQEHADAQRQRYHDRLVLARGVLGRLGIDAALPEGGIYLWVPAPQGDAWGLTERLAIEGGAIVSPGEFYGPSGAGHVRLAVVQPDDRLELVARRLAP